MVFLRCNVLFVRFGDKVLAEKRDSFIDSENESHRTGAHGSHNFDDKFFFYSTSITTPFTCRWWQWCFCGWRGAFKRRNGGERRRQPCLNGFLGEEGQQLHHHHHHHPGGGGRQLPLRADLQQPWPTLGQAAWLWTRLVVVLCSGLFGCWFVLF